GQGSRLQFAGPTAALVRSLPVPGSPVSFTHGQLQEVYAASGPGGTWGFDNRLHQWVDITPRGVPVFKHLEIGNGSATRVVLGLTRDALYRWDTYYGETFVRPPPPLRGIGDPNH